LRIALQFGSLYAVQMNRRYTQYVCINRYRTLDKYEPMIKLKILCSFLMVLPGAWVNCQNIFAGLNSLPMTLEVRAPVFNTLKHYNFEVDTIKNNLYIQDKRLSPSNKIHFYQWLYEIPLDNIGDQSFCVNRKGLESETISLSIKTSGRQNSILTYWFQNDGISSIMAGSGITLGEWEYSDSLFKYLNMQATNLNSHFNSSGLDQTNNQNETGGFKYVAPNVEKRNVTYAEDLTIGNGYIFKPLIEAGESYNSNNLALKVKRYLTKLNGRVTYPIPVIIYASNNDIEYVAVINPGNTLYLKKVDLKLKFLDGAIDPSKYVFLINQNVL